MPLAGDRDPVAPDHLGIAIQQVPSKALADVFPGRGRHGAVAVRLTEAVMADFARVDWQVTMPRRRQMGDR